MEITVKLFEPGVDKEETGLTNKMYKIVVFVDGKKHVEHCYTKNGLLNLVILGKSNDGFIELNDPSIHYEEVGKRNMQVVI